jgi:hypothetical protein
MPCYSSSYRVSAFFVLFISTEVVETPYCFFRVSAIPRQYNHALFSALAPNTHVRAHYGPTNKKLRCHLPLCVPPGGRCTITVSGESVVLEEGKCILFDDSFLHEASNVSDLPRVVLIVDTWHPDLTDEEVKLCSCDIDASVHFISATSARSSF